jgi:hypothetical protein
VCCYFISAVTILAWHLPLVVQPKCQRVSQKQNLSEFALLLSLAYTAKPRVRCCGGLRFSLYEAVLLSMPEFDLLLLSFRRSYRYVVVSGIRGLCCWWLGLQQTRRLGCLAIEAGVVGGIPASA